MKNVFVWPIIFVLLVCPIVSPLAASASSGAMQKPEKLLLGKLSNGEYSFPEGKLKIKIPPLVEPEAKIRDERVSGLTQVILTDVFGAFYRVFILDNSRGEFDIDVAIKIFKGIREKETITTPRGKELRIVDVEKEGAELTITKMWPDKKGQAKWEQRRPDLLTANAAFASDQMIICVTAGLPMNNAGKMNEQVVEVKERLDKFLSGIEVTGNKK
jgi:hypothetical protein